MCTAHAQKAGLLLKPPRTLILIFINCFSPAVSSVSEKIKIPPCFLVILQPFHQEICCHRPCLSQCTWSANKVATVLNHSPEINQFWPLESGFSKSLLARFWKFSFPKQLILILLEHFSYHLAHFISEGWLRTVVVGDLGVIWRYAIPPFGGAVGTVGEECLHTPDENCQLWFQSNLFFVICQVSKM